MTAEGWRPLGTRQPTALLDARLQLHHAAQLAAAAGATFLPARPDDSHPNLGWVDGLDALVGHAIPGPPAFQVGLHVADLRLLVRGGDGRTADLTLEGRTLREAGAWLSGAIARYGVRLPAGGVTPPRYELPHHPVAVGAAFDPDPAACAELARWFADGHAVLADLVPRLEGAQPARVWPHHFDLGTLTVVERAPGGAVARSIGIGLSPGDESYAEPYWYVSPWPHPPQDALPPPTSGRWHREGFVAAVLTATELLSGPAAARRRRLEGFLSESIAASRASLGGSRA